MPMPLSVRRQRLFIFCAVVIVFLLYRVVQNSWDDSNVYADLRSGYNKPPGVGHPPPPADYEPEVEIPAVQRPVVVERPGPKPEVETVSEQKEDKPVAGFENEIDEKVEDKIPSGADQGIEGSEKGSDVASSSKKQGQDTADTKDETGTSAESKLADEKTDVPTKTEKTSDISDIEWKNPPVGETIDIIENALKRVHWEKLPEHYPLPVESIAPLPSGRPKSIPKIQADFESETEKAKTLRTTRLQQVRTEIKRSWTAYRENAWGHDELSPVSGKNRDPFCGWAATMVDSLDTLWIAGMEDEFAHAVKAVADIDFTYTPRNDIPVFETTIRYLGGLLGAFDISGGHNGDYKVLLDKAVELGEILIGIFDTPNRMPMLYYQWKPQYVSQPSRATRAGVAELATLSLEFTRLAQLTQDNKYYDAIDRITNGLIEMQEAGLSAIPGLFPESLDVSGCNKTATTIRDNLSKEAQRQLDAEKTLGEPEGYVPKRASKTHEHFEGEERPDDRVLKRDLDSSEVKVSADTEGKPPFAANGKTADWDCVPQGIVPTGHGRQVFHMGGAQDSAYEYFPKEYLLLGGLEPKYQKLYEDTVEAVNNWLLFRPQAAKNWNVLFPAKISYEDRVTDSIVPTFEITHLTCFIGGMYGLGGRIFGREEDVQLAKELTDGCVWAYQTTPSGLMPESAKVLPCPTLDNCEYNETSWHEALDPSKAWREKQVEQWDKEVEDMKEAARLAEEAGVEEKTQPEPGSLDAHKADEAEKLAESALNWDKTRGAELGSELRSVTDTGVDEAAVGRDAPKSDAEIGTPDSQARAEAQVPESDVGSGSVSEDAPPTDPKTGSDHGDAAMLGKRAAVLPFPGQKHHESKDEDTVDDEDEDEEFLDLKTQKARPLNFNKGEKPTPTEDEEVSLSAKEKPLGKDSSATEGIPKYSTPEHMIPGRKRPQTHEEFVNSRIRKERLPPGYTEISSADYILRPEAIESVWYMYRITGDPTWQDKGWTMWEATITATRTKLANSAVSGVTREQPRLKDAMESFWIAETLKYYYLLFAEPDVVSLDEWVFNTEAHPFRRPT